MNILIPFLYKFSLPSRVKKVKRSCFSGRTDGSVSSIPTNSVSSTQNSSPREYSRAHVNPTQPSLGPPIWTGTWEQMLWCHFGCCCFSMSNKLPLTWCPQNFCQCINITLWQLTSHLVDRVKSQKHRSFWTSTNFMESGKFSLNVCLEIKDVGIAINH